MWIRRYTIGKDENGLPIKTIVNVAHISEWTYVGKNMGERKVTATVKSPVTIDFLIDDWYLDSSAVSAGALTFLK